MSGDAQFYFWHGVETIVVTYMQAYVYFVAGLFVCAAIVVFLKR